MHRSRGPVWLLVRELKSELLQYPPRSVVGRMMSGEQRRGPEFMEPKSHRRARRFESEAAPPTRPAQVISQLENPLFGAVRPQPGAARKRAVIKQKEGPILHAVRFPAGDFPLQSLTHLLFRKRPAEQRRHVRVAPQRPRQRPVAGGPAVESQPFRSEEVSARVRQNPTLTENCSERAGN